MALLIFHFHFVVVCYMLTTEFPFPETGKIYLFSLKGGEIPYDAPIKDGCFTTFCVVFGCTGLVLARINMLKYFLKIERTRYLKARSTRY